VVPLKYELELSWKALLTQVQETVEDSLTPREPPPNA
jgi:hypothetical protein